MKITTFIISLILISNLLAQNNYIFTELKGLEDQNGNTWLAYRKDLASEFFLYHDVYLYDVMRDKDTMIINAYYYNYPWGQLALWVEDYEFWKNEPLKFAYSGGTIAPDNHGYISLYNGTSRGIMFPVINVELSYQNSDLIYASGSFFTIMSVDGGLTWDETWPRYDSFILLSVNKYDDKILFGVNRDGYLCKSLDSGKTYVVIDTSMAWSGDGIEFYYVNDNQNIYGIFRYRHFVRSSNNGNSWAQIYSDTSRLYLSVDESQPNKIYFAKLNKIYESIDYGTSFTLYKTLNNNIVGIYKKPNSNLIYAATPRDIYEITPDSIRSIKRLTTPVEDEKTPIPKSIILYQNYPNPFNSSTSIKYSVLGNEYVSLKVYDVLGREVTTLVNEEKSPGGYEVRFDMNNALIDRRITSGVYFYQLCAGGFVETKKMIYIK